MLSRAVKEHTAQRQNRKDQQEKKRKEVFESTNVVVDKLVSTLNDGVEEIYQNQKKLESEAKQLQTHTAQFSKQSIQWLQLAEGFNRALKELGDIENWSQVIEAEMTTIAGALEYAYKGDVPG
ncbi:biogenesis of lysosome-related organelles complex 1 subunit 1-like [Xenia sp. Carnegie-2017]|uniref:biogenesis of lysosome-related organelles complex 1 subunit 1-like n=1 Tax=Xenia sp. Carnegie-2017 TaxID=2897299 RepID=UPI001F04F0E4|nr:biogenesis of lysosome-related organelles complex 1 subunit 1-like [Xenia sp. Carnegie-2017]XP_046847175.1 biogenesis of lysosome-related organelles complex 1 subunit 1-like [Xenia sp. Carnegie-2017]XP_046847176.1 biogenesis of lysosome-related organelles complex 1 subunit 1-like [Xenia sp. Carnegie-2017]XP_046847177.1 biogenesis of lysosome-related organelles complex 1 subunit 1-like [Xenia sp. Carnegie-2017]